MKIFILLFEYFHLNLLAGFFHLRCRSINAYIRRVEKIDIQRGIKLKGKPKHGDG